MSEERATYGDGRLTYFQITAEAEQTLNGLAKEAGINREKRQAAYSIGVGVFMLWNNLTVNCKCQAEQDKTRIESLLRALGEPLSVSERFKRAFSIRHFM